MRDVRLREREATRQRRPVGLGVLGKDGGHRIDSMSGIRKPLPVPTVERSTAPI